MPSSKRKPRIQTTSTDENISNTHDPTNPLITGDPSSEGRENMDR